MVGKCAHMDGTKSNEQPQWKCAHGWNWLKL